MHSSGVVIATPLRALRGAFIAVGLTFALFVSGAMVAATPVHAAAAALKAVFIVGPAGSQTSANLADAESLAVAAESYGMDVRRCSIRKQRGTT